MKKFQLITREISDNFFSRCLLSVYAICNACQCMSFLNSGLGNALPHINGINSKIVFGALENKVFIVKHAAESGKLFFRVNMATAATHINDEVLSVAICDTGKAYKLIYALHNVQA